MVTCKRPDPAAHIAAAIRASAGSWLELFRPDALYGMSVAVATSAPSLAIADQIALGKLGAWICAFDDFIDTAAVDHEVVELRIAQYERLVEGDDCPELAFDPIARMFGEVLDHLRGAPLGPALWPVFATQLVVSLRAMVCVSALAAAHRAGHVVALDRYLHHAADSVCVTFVTTAAAMLLGERSALEHLGKLVAAERHSAMVIRLANDRATWPREQLELAANALAFAPIEELDARDAAAHDALTACLAELPLPRIAEFIRRFTRFFVAMYQRGDLEDVAGQSSRRRPAAQPSPRVDDASPAAG